MELRSKERFWTGITMGAIEVLGLFIFGLALVKWNIVYLSVIGIVLYNLLAIILVWNGSGRDIKMRDKNGKR